MHILVWNCAMIEKKYPGNETWISHFVSIYYKTEISIKNIKLQITSKIGGKF